MSKRKRSQEQESVQRVVVAEGEYLYPNLLRVGAGEYEPVPYQWLRKIQAAVDMRSVQSVRFEAVLVVASSDASPEGESDAQG